MEKADAGCMQSSKAATAVTTETRRMDVAPKQAAIVAHARRQNCYVRATLLKDQRVKDQRAGYSPGSHGCAIKNSWRVRLKPLEVESEIQDDCANSWGCGGGSSQKALRTNQSRRYAERKSRRITFNSMDVYIERQAATGRFAMIEA
jgi:hypothetical protein